MFLVITVRHTCPGVPPRDYVFSRADTHRINIGSYGGADVPLMNEPHAKRLHATLQLLRNRVLLHVLAGASTTYLDNKPALGTAVLGRQHVITMGSSRLEITVGDSQRPPVSSGTTAVAGREGEAMDPIAVPLAETPVETVRTVLREAPPPSPPAATSPCQL